MNNELKHYGILGMKWGVRRYQNEDGTLTEAGRRRIQRKDERWAHKKYDKITDKVSKRSSKEMKEAVNTYLTPTFNKDGRHLSANYVNAYNKKLAEVMTKNAKDIKSPSGREISFVAKRGELGVHMVLADSGYDMSEFKNGVWSGGRIAYTKKQVSVSEE